MKKLTTIFAALALMVPTPALGHDEYIEITEIELERFEARLEKIFDNAPYKEFDIKFVRTSKIGRQADALAYCKAMDEYSVDQILENRERTRYELYKDDPYRLKNEITYEYAIAISAIEAICPHHKAELLKYFEKSHN